MVKLYPVKMPLGEVFSWMGKIYIEPHVVYINMQISTLESIAPSKNVMFFDNVAHSVLYIITRMATLY